MTTEAWLPDLDGVGIKYQAIADAIARAIETGLLGPGARLPPQRDLASRLGVDLTTITRAYDTVRHEGLIEARGRAGSFVRAPAAISTGELRRIETGMNMPPALPGGLLARALTEATQHLLEDGATAHLQYEPSGGTAEDRAIAADLLRTCGVAADDEVVSITAGAQHALHLILAATVGPDGTVLCSEFVYTGFKVAAEAIGARLVALPDFSPDGIARACAEQPVAAIYLVPTNDNPTARTLSQSEREGIAHAARRCGIQIIEDDVYGPLALSRSAPLASLAPERTWYITGSSKAISPALRVAYVRAPGISEALMLRRRIMATAVMAPPLNIAILGHWIRTGTFDRLVNAMRSEARVRQAIAREALSGLAFDAHPQGYHLWLELPEAAKARDIAEVMRSQGLSIHGSEHFAAGSCKANAVRVSLGGLIDHAQLGKCLSVLAGHIASPGSIPLPVV
ncbi:MAG: PLP-dependent aminotransferase family protein [Sphingomonadales bacterium]|nr:PLP-dependent aminotransferase family protein [Sphingomonadales bacterium]